MTLSSPYVSYFMFPAETVCALLVRLADCCLILVWSCVPFATNYIPAMS
jgi:hypothetical protein